MTNLTKRILSGIVYVVVFLLAILLSEESYIILITFFSVISLWEFSRILKVNNILPYMVVLILSAISYVGVDIYIPSKGILILLIYAVFNGVLLVVDLFSKEFKERTHISSLFLQFKYIVLPYFFLILLPFYKDNYNAYIIIYIIVLIWTNDSFAYLIGRNFGKIKLFERISPKKTIEGFIGGLIFAVILGIIIGLYSEEFSIMNGIIIATIISVFGSLGDLVESKFKRQARVKDSGTIMPGHGGLLDRLDSLFFLSPFVYLYIHFLM